MRSLLTAVALMAIASPLAAQGVKPQSQDKDPSHKIVGGKLPPGWSVRVDDKDAVRGMTANDLKFIPMGPGMHVTSGPAAIFYNPKDVENGSYTVHATFTQEKAPMHPEAYGVFVGGANLPTSSQQYLYFIVRGDGKYMINHRAGSVVHKLAPWTANDAVHKQDADGKATNTVAIRVAPDSVHFLVNGTQVQAFSKEQMHGMSPEGQAGFRVNHNLDVHVADFGITK